MMKEDIALKKEKTLKSRRRLPPWFKIRLPGKAYYPVEQDIKRLKLDTICVEAKCPNRIDCWQRHSATFLILGNICTRNCRFCSVKSGVPASPDPLEAHRIVQFIKKYSLKYVVLTSVTRDDLPDGGASHFAFVIREIQEKTRAYVEVLIPDFNGQESAIYKVLAAKPVVLAHNIETVRRLTPQIRSKADYELSLEVLRIAKRYDSNMLTKSGIMLGLGETLDEVKEALEDLRKVQCDIVTLGQYLQPTPNNISVERFVTPNEFEDLRDFALKLGFKKVFSGPFVRSSYHADEAIELISS